MIIDRVDGYLLSNDRGEISNGKGRLNVSVYIRRSFGGRKMYLPFDGGAFVVLFSTIRPCARMILSQDRNGGSRRDVRIVAHTVALACSRGGTEATPEARTESADVARGYRQRKVCHAMARTRTHSSRLAPSAGWHVVTPASSGRCVRCDNASSAGCGAGRSTTAST
jgi:hypothetical protein